MKGSIRKKGDSYYYRIHTATLNIERYGGETRAEANKALRDAIQELETSGLVFKDVNIIFYDLLLEWLETVKPTIKYGTYKDYENVIKNHLQKEEFVKLKVGLISIQMLQEYINKKCAKYSASTIKSHFVVLNRSLEYAVYPLRYIKESPMHYVKRPKQNKDDILELLNTNEKKTETITIDEYKTILSKINPYLQLVFNISFYTGARLGEVCSLTWDDIDFENRQIMIKKNLYYNRDLKLWEIGKTKNGRPRLVDISDKLITILKDARKAHLTDKMSLGEFYKQKYIDVQTVDNITHLVVTDEQTDNPMNFICVQHTGQLITNQYVKTNITRNIRKGGKGIDFHFHMLRHTHATMLIQNGVSMKEVQDRLGHTKISTTMDIYAHTTAASRRNTADIFDALM